jgi:hypothetical protein
MITAKLNGGLGNQMFQVAVAYTMALDNNDQCAFDFNTVPVLQGQCPVFYRDNIFKKLNNINNGWKPRVIYKEITNEYTKIPYGCDMKLIGYFASEEYIKNRRAEILDLFIDKDIIKLLRDLFNDKLKNSVSLHVRRGDYLKFPEVYVILSQSYYELALNIIGGKYQINNILVFSDDIEWCKQNMNDSRMYFIEGYPDYIDMYLMSLCNHNITANSSFSWWGAYLNENKEKIVCAPKKWFNYNGPKSSSYLLCKDWLGI